jgi:hypothetical protein
MLMEKNNISLLISPERGFRTIAHAQENLEEVDRSRCRFMFVGQLIC